MFTHNCSIYRVHLQYRGDIRRRVVKQPGNTVKALDRPIGY